MWASYEKMAKMYFKLLSDAQHKVDLKEKAIVAKRVKIKELRDKLREAAKENALLASIVKKLEQRNTHNS